MRLIPNVEQLFSFLGGMVLCCEEKFEEARNERVACAVGSASIQELDQ